MGILLLWYSVSYLLGVPNRGHGLEQFISPLSRNRHLRCAGNVCLEVVTMDMCISRHHGNALGQAPPSRWAGCSFQAVRNIIIMIMIIVVAVVTGRDSSGSFTSTTTNTYDLMKWC
jgi:hypothetical protein